MNGTFLLLAMGLCLVALGFVVTPLLRAPRCEESQSCRALSLAVHCDRLSELEQDLVAGMLTQDQYATALADLERELLDSGVVEPTARQAARGPGSRRAPFVAACASLALLPFLATGLYLTVGHAEEVFATPLSSGASTPGEAAAEPRSGADLKREFRHLALQLQGRLAQDPSDLESWVLLGRTLVFLGDPEGAERAFREAEVIRGNLGQLDQADDSLPDGASARRER